MKQVRRISIRRRLLVGVAAVQILAATLAMVLVVTHEWRRSYALLDASLSEHATLVKSVIQLPDGDHKEIVVHRELMNLPRHDQYVLLDASGRLIAASSEWRPVGSLPPASHSFVEMKVDGRKYRALVVRSLAVLNLDPDEVAGTLPDLTLIYATPTAKVTHELWEVASRTGGVCLAVLLLSLAATWWVVTTGMRPVVQIVERATRIDTHNWENAEPAAVVEAEELQPLSAALTNLVARLRSAFERERQFSADAAHEMKTAVAIVKSTLQLSLGQEREAAKYRVDIERALEDTQRLQRLVSDMLQLAKIESLGESSAAFEVRECDVYLELATVKQQLSPLLESRNVRLVVEPIGDMGSVTMTADDFEVVMTNLLENAINASEDGNEVRVSVQSAGESCRLSVTDHGCGIPAAVFPHIFERFVRGDASRSRKRGGNGLGLAITQALLQRVGGSIAASSVPGVGSEFVVTVPYARRVL